MIPRIVFGWLDCDSVLTPVWTVENDDPFDPPIATLSAEPLVDRWPLWRVTDADTGATFDCKFRDVTPTLYLMIEKALWKSTNVLEALISMSR